jgi:hypothetical protein
MIKISQLERTLIMPMIFQTPAFLQRLPFAIRLWSVHNLVDYNALIVDVLNPETTAAPKIGFWMIENGPKCCINVIFHPILCLY